MFRITMLPAAQGDCLWLEYGSSRSPKRMLIDGGVHASAAELRTRIDELPKSKRVFELAVITHIDLDHIAGMLKLLENPPQGLVIKEFWFNGWQHLPETIDDDDKLGAKMGEELMERIRRQTNVIKGWNTSFNEKAVSVGSMELPKKASKLPSFDFDGMRLTVLGPVGSRLQRLRPVWEQEIKKLRLRPGAAGAKLIGHPEDVVKGDTTLGAVRLASSRDIERLANGKFKEDTSQANGSSIVLLAEHQGKRCLFAGDAIAKDLLAAATLVAPDGEPLAVDAWKIAHHGGEKNTGPELIGAVATDRYLLSTSGSKYEHPKAETLARLLVHRPDGEKPQFHFNYQSKFTGRWKDAGKFGSKYRYQPLFPTTDGTKTIDL
jgi:beta-lactamase superfamily II metal-dependent hydrolase